MKSRVAMGKSARAVGVRDRVGKEGAKEGKEVAGS